MILRYNKIQYERNFIFLKVKAQTNQSSEKFCKTLCGDSGCRCVSQLPLNDIDHVILASESNHVIICLCGNHQVKLYII